MRKVLLAVDLRTDAADVVAQGIPWIRRLDAVVDVVFVDTYRTLLDLYTPPAFRAELESLVRDAEVRMEAVLAALPDANRGRPIFDLTSLDQMIEVRAPEYGMVMVGTRGRVGLAHLWAGSVAERIVRFCRRSVLVLRERPLRDPAQILFAVDPTEDPAPLSSALATLAESIGARVDLLGIYELPTLAATLDAPSLFGLLAQQGAEAQVALTTRLTGIHAAHFPASVQGAVHVALGGPVQEILHRAPGYDLVVVGTHGRTGIAHAMLGSVAERVMRRSPGPVLVLRP